MKFGKTYLETLQGIPAEWRAQAIEYRKVSKRLAKEALQEQQTKTIAERANG